MTTDQPGGTGEAASIAAAMAAADALKIIVRPLLEALRGPGAADIAAGLRPRSEDCARVFVAEAVEPAREAYARLWDGAPPFKRPDSLRSVLEIFVAPAGMLGQENMLSWQFPGGYRAIAPLLRPHRVWVAWSYVQPGQRGGGLAFDGLVWCEDHWSWFPRPYRILAHLVP